MTSRYIFLDLETSGLPKMIGFNKYYKYDELHAYDSSRIVQLAMAVYDDSKLVETHNVLIKPVGYEIKNSEFHNITHEHALVYGINLIEMKEIFNTLFTKNTLLIAHNVQFDKNVLLSELFRCRMEDICILLESMEVYCTCTNSTHITKIPFSQYAYKLPKLSELYEFLFHEKSVKQHDAMGDVETLAKIYFELQKRNLLIN